MKQTMLNSLQQQTSCMLSTFNVGIQSIFLLPHVRIVHVRFLKIKM